jgi:predicted nuclease with RNAse H fold
VLADKARPVFLGVDVAGQSNTWVTALAARENDLEVIAVPHTSSLSQILAYCEAHHVVSVAIDAQLTVSVSEDGGFRDADRTLRSLLPPECRNWVASVNSLMAVPVRGRLLAEMLSPLVGTIIETHPRACLLFGLEKSAMEPLGQYKNKKRGAATQDHVAHLLEAWCARYGIASRDDLPLTDGAVDSLVCATVAYLFHRDPGKLLRLATQAGDLGGRGPFFVVAPIQGSGVHG